MYYDLLKVEKSVDAAAIKTAYFDRYKEADVNVQAKLNKAKTCLLDEESRKAYNEALAEFGIEDGAAKTTGLQEIIRQRPNQETLPADITRPVKATADPEKQFEVTHGTDMTECMAHDLESLQTEAGDGLNIKKDTFLITYMNKGKRIIVRTQGNYKIMVSKQPNAEGNFEVNCELIEVEKAKPEQTPVSSQQAKPEPTTVVKKPPAGLEYSPPDIAQMRPENVYDHLSDVFYPYTTELARAGLLTSNGKKTLKI